MSALGNIAYPFSSPRSGRSRARARVQQEEQTFLQPGGAFTGEVARRALVRRFREFVQQATTEQCAQPMAATRDPRTLVTQTNEAPSEPQESAEMAWLLGEAPRLAGYAGEWLLIRGNELLAHSSDFRLIKETIQEYGIRSPFVYYVPGQEESNSITI